MPGLTITGTVPTSSAFPSLAGGLSGIGPVAVEQALGSQPTTPQEPAPANPNEIVVTGSGYTAPTSGLSRAVSSAVSNLLTQPQPTTPQEPAPADPNEIVVTGRSDAPIVSNAFSFPEAIGMSLPLATIGSTLASVPPAPPPKTPLQKALTTGGRVLTGLSILGGLAGGGGPEAPPVWALGPLPLARAPRWIRSLVGSYRPQAGHLCAGG
jgi:hypothetical protein